MSADERQSHLLVEGFKLALQDPRMAADLKSKGLTAEQVRCTLHRPAGVSGGRCAVA